MTTNKRLKERVRARMQRTGESYVAAHANVAKDDAPQGKTIPLPPTRRRNAFGGVHGCEYGDYPWDHWFARAKAAGVPEKLAHLGRSLMREADQHGWCRELWERCGWTKESNEGMVRFALEEPAVADTRWGRLMMTDGCTVDLSADFRELGDEEFDSEYTAFAFAFDRYFPAARAAGEEEDPLVQIPGAPIGVFAPRSRVEKL